MFRAIILSLLFQVTLTGSAFGHALEPGYLDLRQMTPETWQVFWRKPDVNSAPMAIDAVLAENCTPASGPAPNFDGAAWVSAWVADCSGDLTGTEISISGLSAQRTDVLLRMKPLHHSSSTTRLTPDAPSHTVPLIPTTWGVFASYSVLGFEHILEGLDHLLFVFALLVLIREKWRLIGAITAFTVAHSITLALASLGHISIPGPPVEAVIALSIVFLAVEILKHRDGEFRLSERYPWIVSFSFGLLHGLGFAGALTEIGLPQQDIPIALLAFNIGVELGQLVFVAAVMFVFLAFRAFWPTLVHQFRQAHSSGTVLAGYAIGCIATFWFVERVTGF